MSHASLCELQEPGVTLKGQELNKNLNFGPKDQNPEDRYYSEEVSKLQHLSPYHNLQTDKDSRFPLSSQWWVNDPEPNFTPSRQFSETTKNGQPIKTTYFQNLFF